MADFAQRLIDSGFASSVAHYLDGYPGHPDPRIVLTIRIGERMTISAVVDTAAPWCVLDPEIAELIRDRFIDEDTRTTTIGIRGSLYPGKLVRVRVGVLAEIGASPEIEATVFVPALTPDQPWDLPNFLGLTGFLERLRFAVDPATNMFALSPV